MASLLRRLVDLGRSDDEVAADELRDAGARAGHRLRHALDKAAPRQPGFGLALGVQHGDLGLLARGAHGDLLAQALGLPHG